MSLPDDVVALLGVPQYERESDRVADARVGVDVCVATRNANPIHWDPDVAAALSGGTILPPSSLSTWMRPLPWRPAADLRADPLQVHFDLKERFGLPRAVMTALDVTYREPVRPGDRVTTRQVLRGVGEPTTTALGSGRFWEIDVEYRNQHGEVLGVETYTGFGYGPDDSGFVPPAERDGDRA